LRFTIAARVDPSTAWSGTSGSERRRSAATFAFGVGQVLRADQHHAIDRRHVDAEVRPPALMRIARNVDNVSGTSA